jgi:hypothetical protein
MYARADHAASDKQWLAYECGNPQSEYYGCLLNIKACGSKLPIIVWDGCDKGEFEKGGAIA